MALILGFLTDSISQIHAPTQLGVADTRRTRKTNFPFPVVRRRAGTRC